MNAVTTKCNGCGEFQPRIGRVWFKGKLLFLCQACRQAIKRCCWCKDEVLKTIRSFGDWGCVRCHDEISTEYHEQTKANRLAYARS